jgi:hypothetical protein
VLYYVCLSMRYFYISRDFSEKSSLRVLFQSIYQIRADGILLWVSQKATEKVGTVVFAILILQNTHTTLLTYKEQHCSQRQI